MKIQPSPQAANLAGQSPIAMSNRQGISFYNTSTVASARGDRQHSHDPSNRGGAATGTRAVPSGTSNAHKNQGLMGEHTQSTPTTRMPLSQRGLRQSGQLVGNGMQNKYVAESLDSGVFMHMGNQQNGQPYQAVSSNLNKTNRRGGVN